MIYLPFIMSFLISYSFIDVGILIIILNVSTITIPYFYREISGVGGIQVSDFALIGIAAKLFVNKKLNYKNENGIFFNIFLWLLFISILEILPGGSGVNAAYNLFVREGLIWLLPISIICMTSKQKMRIFVYLIFCSLFVTLAQIYAFSGNNSAFVVGAYYQFQNSDVYQNPEENLNDHFNSGDLPRLYPNGTSLVLMIFVFITSVLLSKKYKSRKETFGLYALVFLLLIFVLSLRQRSAVIVFFVTAIYIMYQLRKNINLRKMIIYFAFSGLVLFGGLKIFEEQIQFSFLNEIQERFQLNFIYQNNRILDNILALKVITHSPILGVGRTNVIPEASVSSFNTLGVDVHPILESGLLAGIPMVLLVFRMILFLFRQYRKEERLNMNWLLISLTATIVFALLSSLINTLPIFTSRKEMVPFLVLVGLFLSFCQSKPQRKTVNDVNALNKKIEGQQDGN